MRDLGHEVVELLVSHFESLSNKPVSTTASRPQMETLFRESPPEEGMPWDQVLKRVRDDVFSHIMHVDHPRFLSFVPSPGNFVGAMADALVSGMNVFAGTWMEAAGPAQIELVTVDWLREICGLPDAAGGLFVSGGSVANITALAVARQKCLGDDFRNGMVYMSDQTHSSVRRGLRLLGFTPDQLVIIPSDDDYRIPMDALSEHVDSDRAADRTPFCIVANAGTTNTGAMDPLPELADFCSLEGIWLHADGAFGAAAALCPRGKELLSGLERVDSLSVDPHKWLFQPIECGVILVRDRAHLRETFHVLPEYLKDIEGESEEVNFYDYGIQLTRGFRALKLWMSIQVFGLGAFRAAIERGIVLAEYAETLLRERAHWEVVSPARMGVITFRHLPSDGRDLDAYNRSLIQPLLEDGFALVMTTEIKGKTVLRFCTINPRTTEEDIKQTIERLEYYASQMQ